MNIAWGITGAGEYLEESIKVMRESSEGHRITAFLSLGGEEVLRIYGLEKKLKEICTGDYLREVFYQSKEGQSAPPVGRFYLRRYDLLIVSPATTNTIAKVANGIADTLVTNAVAHAMKVKVPIAICPTDIKEKTIELPYSINKEICVKCEPCAAEKACPRNAIKNYSIELKKCISCGICEEACEYGAIKREKVKITPRKIDLENLEKIKEMGIKIIEKPWEIIEIITQP
ncbi:MAG: dihydromethanopterin reductase (acceptor) [Candidatus Hydrothermarchaeota archaeon]|nr:MAG: dihydromethanopterin reductase (acceptor) [Candidatus Hydrothermarchaeota archaeon]